jgi:hypothetical protein
MNMMNPMTTSPARSADSRYRRGTFAAMAYYAVAICAAVYVAERELLSGIWLYMLAAQPGAAIAIQIWVTLRYLREADEYVRTLMAKRLIAAAMGALAIITVWGFLETFAGVVHIPGWWGYILMWFLFGLSGLVIKDSK